MIQIFIFRSIVAIQLREYEFIQILNAGDEVKELVKSVLL